MINWNEVKAGDTEVVDPCGQRYLVLWRDGHTLWLKTGVCYYSRAFESMQDWSIYDPWEEITEWCEFVRIAADGHYWKLYHNNHLIHNDNPNYKVKLPRVWKREEG